MNVRVYEKNKGTWHLISSILWYIFVKRIYYSTVWSKLLYVFAECVYYSMVKCRLFYVYNPRVYSFINPYDHLWWLSTLSITLSWIRTGILRVLINYIIYPLINFYEGFTKMQRIANPFWVYWYHKPFHKRSYLHGFSGYMKGFQTFDKR